ncbi:MAG: transposase [Sphingomonas sp.]|uniref:transposase n=1 Tax=Sphingomonas sp. TaxID=28214 RepID=UPI00258889BF|nr:transposase [Sphingomonas sp.]MCP4026879.1 transposase [Sphingomonas sp.]
MRGPFSTPITPLPGSLFHADPHLQADYGNQWEPLHLHFDVKRINHSEFFSKDGACTNQAESFFSRMRSGEHVHKHISGAHISRYAMELGWKEQYSRTPNGTQVAMILATGGRTKPSGTFRGYWRKRGNNDNDLLAAIAS